MLSKLRDFSFLPASTSNAIDPRAGRVSLVARTPQGTTRFLRPATPPVRPGRFLFSSAHMKRRPPPTQEGDERLHVAAAP